jgi:hypothetical protein
MLKISVAQTDTECRLLLEGALVGVGLEELRTLGNRLRAELHGRRLLVDIKDAAAISQEGENILLQLINEGAKGTCTQHHRQAYASRTRSPQQKRTGGFSRCDTQKREPVTNQRVKAPYWTALHLEL